MLSDEQIILQIDESVKNVWLNDIKKDLNDNYILYEDTLKNVMYYHMRRNLEDLLKNNSIRIYTEFHDNEFIGKGLIPDIAIVRINDKETDHLKNNIEKIYAIIELKFKAKNVPIDCFVNDVNKVIGYIKNKKLNGCQFYLGFIHEGEFNSTEISWLHGIRQQRYAKGRLTELSANYYTDSEEMKFTVFGHNEINYELNSFANDSLKY